MKAFEAYRLWSEDFSKYEIRLSKDLTISEIYYDNVVVVTPYTYKIETFTDGSKAMFDGERYVDLKTDNIILVCDICTE